MNNAKILYFLLPFLLLLSAGCEKEEAREGMVILDFDHKVGGEELVLDEIRYNSEAGHKYSVVRLKYYVSNFILYKADGTTFQLDRVHYREVGAPKTRSFTLERVPKGDYTSLSFIFGLDETTNVDGGLENTITNINMEWPLPGDRGYHYMKFEGKYDSLGMGVVKNFNLHTGATGGNQNYLEVTLALNSLPITSNTWTITLQMDLNEWLQNPHTYDFETFGPMIMANQDAQEVLKANGATVFSVASVVKE